MLAKAPSAAGSYHQIIQMTPAYSYVSKHTWDSVAKKHLGFGAFFYQEMGNRKIRRDYIKYLTMGKTEEGILFPTGLVPRLVQKLEEEKVRVSVECKYQDILKAIPLALEPSLPGIKFRDDQTMLIRKATRKQRGMIVSPTGSGKTILQMGLISAFPDDHNFLILVHLTGIVEQTYQELEKFGFSNIQKLHGGEKIRDLYGQVVISTIQTFANLDPNDYFDYFTGVLVDESHRVSQLNGQYAKVLGSLMAPIRIGFTATPPTEPEAILVSEGFLGPIIQEFTVNEASEHNIIAKPRIKIIKLPNQAALAGARGTYNEIYQVTVVLNEARNQAVFDVAKNHVDQGGRALIFVQKIEHGNILSNLFWKNKLPVQFVRGATDSELRESIKERFNTGDVKCVIATAVWKEGINIPNITMVINAAGGKSEIQTLQSIGRGLRRKGDKEEVIIVDFFDPSHKILLTHFGDRICLYSDNNWI